MLASPRRSRTPVFFLACLTATGALPGLVAQKPPPALTFGAAPWPAHPTLLLAKFRGGFAPVVAADKDAPVIVVDGQRQTLPASTELVTRLAPDYVPVQVEGTGGLSSKFEHLTIQGTPTADPIDSASAKNSVTLKPDRDLPDCFLLVVTFDTMSLQHPDADDHFRTSLVEIGPLRAGEARTVPFTARATFADPMYEGNRTDPIYTKPETGVFWQIYSHGLEVKTGDLANVQVANSITVDGKMNRAFQRVNGLGLFFYQHERAGHADAVDAWARANRHGNQPVQPYGQTPLVTGPAASRPHEASALLSVGADGKVTNVVLEAAFPPDAAQSLAGCLRLWLFLPAIKNGTPVATRIRVPLEF